ncbi:hypothetical protein [Streptomyces sp. CC228A]|uniref:hypothetical protein n=1 Tax=Streptomyces sp. CC228A TaxID=2898186 RepID=UPI001F33A50B|nr:hypothetical protein [Streptomyces sp. CC228A]
MSATTGTTPPGLPTPLFDHALQLHRLSPDRALPRDGEPYPDDLSHRRRRGPKVPEDRRSAGREAALILDAHFARATAQPHELADAFHTVHVPIHPNEHLKAAAERADEDRARATGRWLVRYATDRCSATVGLALVAAVGTPDDFPLIRTIGLLSHRFGPLAAHALESRPGGTEALLWLAERVTGWGRVYALEALCRLDDPAARPWLLRRACDGDFLNGYFAGKVAGAARLHEALGSLGTDSETFDHTGRLLHAMSDCGGMGLTLARYPHSGKVLEAHARHAGSFSPTRERYFTLALLAHHLTTSPPEEAGCSAAQQKALRERYVSVLDQEEWVRTARAGLAEEDHRMLWLAEYQVPQLRLRAFPDRAPAAGAQHTPAADGADQ